MAEARPPKAKGKGAWPSAARKPLDLSNPLSHAEQVRVHEGRPPPKLKGAAKAPTGKGKSPRAPVRKKPSARRGKRAPTRTFGLVSSKARAGLVIFAAVLLAWLWPVLGQAGDGVVPTVLYFYLFAALAVMVVVAIDQRPPWVVPGFLAVLGLIWAGGVAPDLLNAAVGPELGSLWPTAPRTDGGITLWRVIALVLAALGTGLAALSLAPRRAPPKATTRGKLKRR